MAPAAVLAGGGSFSLDVVRSLSSVADVHRLLHEASARERAIDTELEQLLSRRSELEQGLLDLHTSTEEVGAACHRFPPLLPCPAPALHCPIPAVADGTS